MLGMLIKRNCIKQLFVIRSFSDLANPIDFTAVLSARHLFHFIIRGGKLDTLCMYDTPLLGSPMGGRTMRNLINSPLKKVHSGDNSKSSVFW